MRINLLLLALVGLIIYLATGTWNPDSFDTWGKDEGPAKEYLDKNPVTTNYDKLLAYRIATRCVKGQLNDPESAQFPTNERLVRLNAVSGRVPNLKVVSSVRARNGFGGIVRRNWVATVNTDTHVCECMVIE